MISIQVATGDKARNYVVHFLPNECPTCHHKIIAQFVAAVEVTGGDVQACFQCVNGRCCSLFIAYYEDIMGVGVLKRAAPWKPVAPVLPNDVADVSPTFVRAYGQARAAQSYGLDEIAGTGFRKALEFLIKDFCTARRPEDAEQIANCPLAACIKNYVDDARLKKCAARAAWLGTDQTHYIRKWEDKDIEDLNALIELTITWVHGELLTRQFEKEMPDEPSKE